MDFEVAPLSRDKIRNMANCIREILGCSDKPWFPIVEIFEKVMVKIDPEFDWEIVRFEDMPDRHAETRPEENKIYIREDIYEGACDGNGRDRMTIAHEIAHYLLHRHQKPSYARAFDDNKLPPYRSAEWQAKAFAGELLVSKKLCKDMTEIEIADKCGVSFDAAQYQYSNSIHCMKGVMPNGNKIKNTKQ